MAGPRESSGAALGMIVAGPRECSSGAFANAMLEAHKVLEPGNAQVIEARRYERSDDAAQGAPPSGGDDDGR